jgi:hypothetical protein
MGGLDNLILDVLLDPFVLGKRLVRDRVISINVSARSTHCPASLAIAVRPVMAGPYCFAGLFGTASEENFAIAPLRILPKNANSEIGSFMGRLSCDPCRYDHQVVVQHDSHRARPVSRFFFCHVDPTQNPHSLVVSVRVSVLSAGPHPRRSRAESPSFVSGRNRHHHPARSRSGISSLCNGHPSQFDDVRTQGDRCVRTWL